MVLRFRLLFYLVIVLLLETRCMAIEDARPKPKLHVSIYPSVAVGVNERQIEGAMTPFLKWFGERVGCNIEFHFEKKGGSIADLREFAERISRNRGEIGIITGIEYAWIRHHQIKGDFTLDPLVWVSYGELLPKTRILVNKDSNIHSVTDLPDKIVATYDSMPISDKIFLLSQLKEARIPERLAFDRLTVKNHTNAKAAIFAVDDGSAHFLVVNNSMYSHLLGNHPGINLKEFGKPADYPPPVFVGNRQLLEKLEPGLWNKLAEALLTATENKKKHRYADECFKAWKIHGFLPANHAIGKKTLHYTEAYPLDLFVSATSSHFSQRHERTLLYSRD